MIQIDSRENKNSHITTAFKALEVPYIRSKLYVGDYCNLDNPRLVIERKKDILEFAGNVGKQHERFKAELLRLDSIGGKMIILIEETTPIEKWQHKRSQMQGNVIAKIIESWKTKHNIEIVQCKKFESAKKIIEILGG